MDEDRATYAALTVLASCAGEVALREAASRLREVADDVDLRAADELDRLRDFYASAAERKQASS